MVLSAMRADVPGEVGAPAAAGLDMGGVDRALAPESDNAGLTFDLIEEFPVFMPYIFWKHRRYSNRRS